MHILSWNFFQLCTQGGYTINDAEKSELRASIQQFLRWAWRYNKNLEEQAAQLHMLSGWSQIVEVCFFSSLLPMALTMFIFYIFSPFHNADSFRFLFLKECSFWKTGLRYCLSECLMFLSSIWNLIISDKPTFCFEGCLVLHWVHQHLLIVL